MSNQRIYSQDRLAVDLVLLVVRVIVGVIFAVHGAQKLFPFEGGPFLPKFLEQGMPPILAYLVSIGEFGGGIGMILGFLSRFSAASNIVIMIGAIAMVHGKNGFLLQNQGFEYNLALIGLLIPILILGPGQFSLGRYLPFPKSGQTDRPILILE